MIFQSLYSSSGFGVAGAYAGSSGHKAGTDPGQGTLPSQGTYTHTHSPRQRRCRHANSPGVLSLTMWEEAGAPEKTHADRRGGGCENATPTVTLAEDLRFFFVINVTMNETMLLEPLL